MTKTKIAVSIDPEVLSRLDELVEKEEYSSRSQAVESAIQEKLDRRGGNRLIRETAKLDPEYEKSMAEEGISEELGEWPAY